MSDISLMGFAPTPSRSAEGEARGGRRRPRRAWRRGPDRAVGHPANPWQARVWAVLRAAWRRHRTRRCLAELDAYLLKDIGLTHAAAEAEANKPFWVA